MVNVSPDSLKWQIIRDFEGDRLEVVCPLCGERVVQRLNTLDVDETEVIGDALTQHFYMCQRQYPTTVDIAAQLTATAADLLEDDIVSDELVFGVDENIWHIVQGTNIDGEPFCEMEVIPNDDLLIDDVIASQEHLINMADYAILVLKAAKQFTPVAG
jgi:hypothetical protein